MFIIFVFLFLNFSTRVSAEEKKWVGEGDGTGWFDAANWLPEEVPDAADDAVIDIEGTAVAVSQDVNVRSVTLGGKHSSALTVNNFVRGSVKPANASDVAVLNRKDGLLVVKGSAEKITLKGGYKDSEEAIAEEPTLLFYVR